MQGVPDLLSMEPLTATRRTPFTTTTDNQPSSTDPSSFRWIFYMSYLWVRPLLAHSETDKRYVPSGHMEKCSLG